MNIRKTIVTVLFIAGFALYTIGIHSIVGEASVKVSSVKYHITSNSSRIIDSTSSTYDSNIISNKMIFKLYIFVAGNVLLIVSVISAFSLGLAKLNIRIKANAQP